MCEYDPKGYCTCNDSEYKREEASFGCDGCNQYNPETGDCWKGARQIGGNSSMSQWVLRNGKVVWD